MATTTTTTTANATMSGNKARHSGGGSNAGRGNNNNGQTSNRPFHVTRRGLLKAVIWENQTANGSTMFSTQLVRVYKDGDNWKETHSLNREDLLHAAKLLDAADTVIHREEEARRQAAGDENE